MKSGMRFPMNRKASCNASALCAGMSALLTVHPVAAARVSVVVALVYLDVSIWVPLSSALTFHRGHESLLDVVLIRLAQRH
jgi:hypothetical protein